jgi:hypothetical protein
VTLTAEQLHIALAALKAEAAGFTGLASALRELLRRQLPNPAHVTSAP